MQKIEFSDSFTVESLGIQTEYVYDIEVEDNHNFFGNNICVHNSCYISLDKLVEKLAPNETDVHKKVKLVKKICLEKLEPFIDKSYQELADYMNAYEQKMKMKLECIADKGIWRAKKNYILNVYHQEGVDYSKPKLKVMGIESVKSSTPHVCREKIKGALEVIMNRDEAEIQKYIKDFRKEFYDMTFEQVASPRGATSIMDYSDPVTRYKKGTPMHIRAAIVYNYQLKKLKLDNKYPMAQDGDQIRYCYMIEPNPFNSNVLACLSEMPKEFNAEQYIDYETQFTKTFLDPIKSILDIINWNSEEVTTLESFFD